VGTSGIEKVHDLFEINQDTIELIKKKEGGASTKVINLIKSIQKAAEEGSDDPFLIAMAERAKAVQENFEDRQAATAEVLDELFTLVENNERRKKEQAEKGFDGLTYFVYRTILDAGLSNAEEISKKIKGTFVEHAGWKQSEKELRELRKKVTFAIFSQEDDLNKVTAMVDELFMLLGKADRI
jgi:type I restriction enzyme R subunit